MRSAIKLPLNICSAERRIDVKDMFSMSRLFQLAPELGGGTRGSAVGEVEDWVDVSK